MATRPRYVELRVHGVSGTPAGALVGADEVEEVAGDRLVLFVRPRGRRARTLPGGGELEGMSWGRLTSGPAVQVAWLSLLPFALVNLAFWASTGTRPRPSGAATPGGGRGPAPPASAAAVSTPRGWQDAAFRAVVRLLALTLTVVFTLTVAELSTDLVAWQCAGEDRCAFVSGPLAFAATWETGARVATAAVVPVLVLAVVTWLSHRVSLRYEAVATGVPTQPEGVAPDRTDLPPEDVPQLGSLLMWRGEALVARLRCLHLSVGWATVALLLAGSVSIRLGGPPSGGAAGPLWWSALFLAGPVVAVSVLRLAAPSDWVRWTDAWSPGQRRVAAVLQWTALVSVVLAAVAHALSDAPVGPSTPALPGMAASFGVVAALQLLGLVLLLALPALPRRRQAVPRAPFVIATSAVGLGFVYSSGAALRTADLLSGDTTTVLQVPVYLHWTAAGFAVAVAGALCVAVWSSWWVSRVPVADAHRVADDYAIPHHWRGRGDPVAPLRDDHRVRRIVRARRIQRAVQASWLFRALEVFAVLSILVSARALLSTSWGLDPELPWVTSLGRGLSAVGGWAVTGLVAALVALAVAGWRSEVWRRRIGILWDVLSFWPRGAHPLAPPSYTERAVPQLVARVCHLAGTGTEEGRSPGVVLSGHSQGAVLAVAVVAQLATLDDLTPEDGRTLPRVALLTHGGPLGRIYEPLFPQLFDARQLTGLRDALGGRWVNLWRDTDPIASVLRPLLGRNDRRCRDPAGYDLDGGTAAYPPVRAHSDYPADPEYAEARGFLLDGRRTASP